MAERSRRPRAEADRSPIACLASRRERRYRRMEARPTRTSPLARVSWLFHTGPGLALTGFGAVLGCLLLPAVPILLGVLVLVAVALQAALPDLSPVTHQLLRVPIGQRGLLRTRLAIVASAGVILVTVGAVGASVRGKLHTRWQLRAQRQELAEKGVSGLLEQARALVAKGDFGGAELVLLDAGRIEGLDSWMREDVDALQGRIHRSGDAPAILQVLIGLDDDAFEALAAGREVPEALEFPESSLTMRALSVAMTQIEDARRARGRP